MSKRKISKSKVFEPCNNDSGEPWDKKFSISEATKQFLKGKAYPHLARKVLSHLDLKSALNARKAVPGAFSYLCRDLLIKKRNFYNATCLELKDVRDRELAATLEFMELPVEEGGNTFQDRVRIVLVLKLFIFITDISFIFLI